MPEEKSKKIKASFFKKSAIIGLFFLAFFIFFASSGEKAKAGYCVWSDPNTSKTIEPGSTYTDAGCKQFCANRTPNTTSCTYANTMEIAKQIQGGQAPTTKAPSAAVANAAMKDANTGCGWRHLDICLLTPVMWFVKLILLIAASLFAWIIDAKNIAYVLNGKGAIYAAWTVVRDIINIVFILVLLFSAFCTIFQVAKYNYKKILLTLVIMALLVNFSFPIARVIIDASNVMMYSIIKTKLANPDGTILSLTENSELGAILKKSYPTSGMMLTAIIFIFILAITLLAIAVLLVIRTVALAVIIIFSPLGFVGNIVPGFESYASKWWDNLFRYAFFGPIMMLGLSIAISVMKAMTDINKELPIVGKTSAVTGSASVDPSLIASMSFFAIPIVILWMTMGLAQSMSIAGASTVMGAAQKAIKWSGRTLSGYRAIKWGIKEGSKAGAKKFERDILAKQRFTKSGKAYNLSPRAFIEAWKKNFQASEEEIMPTAAGDWRDKMNKWRVFGKRNTRYGRLERDRLVANKEKETREIGTDAMILNDRMTSIIGTKSSDAKANMQAFLRTFYSQNDQDEILDYIRENMDNDKILPGGGTFRDMGFYHDLDKDGKLKSNVTVSAENATNAVVQLMGSVGVSSEDDVNKLLMDLGTIAMSKGGVGFGAVKYDAEQHKLVRTNLEGGEQAEISARKLMTTNEAQNVPKTMHRNHFTDQSGRLNKEGKALLKIYASPTAIQHINRHKSDFFDQVGANEEITKQMYEYAHEMMAGTAKTWDRKTNQEVAISDTMNEKEYQKRGQEAAAWIAALQSKSGIKSEEIKKQIKDIGKFEPDKIIKIVTDAGKPMADEGLGTEKTKK